MKETRAEFDHGCLTYGVSSRGTYALPGDEVWNWRLEHEAEQRDADWRFFEEERRSKVRKLRILRLLYWSLVAVTWWALWR